LASSSQRRATEGTGSTEKRRLRGAEEAEAEVARKAEGEGAGDGLGEGEVPEGAVGVGLDKAALGTEAVEVDRVARSGTDLNRGDDLRRQQLG